MIFLSAPKILQQAHRLEHVLLALSVSSKQYRNSLIYHLGYISVNILYNHCVDLSVKGFLAF